MKIKFAGLLALTLSLSFAEHSSAQIAAGHVVIPKSNDAVPGSTRRMHTNLRVLMPRSGKPLAAVRRNARSAAGSPPFPGYLFETPASIACVYRLASHHTPGCDPNVVTENPRGGIGAIALVDAFDYPTAASDLALFSTQFDLPDANFKVVYATGARPPVDPTGGWELEEALDIEWAHAMAPQAKIFLVEAASDSDDDLLAAVAVANHLVAGAGGGEISMSWGGDEYPEELSDDSLFTKAGIVYFASAGDSGGTLWPGTSPNVVSAGGTTLSRNIETGHFFSENTWQETGGGPSLYEPRPAFQNRIRHLVGSTRGTPDLSFDANPATGVWVIGTNVEGDTSGQPYWYTVGGTSVSSPSLAGIINSAGGLRLSSQDENEVLYRDDCYPGVLRDVTYGNCGITVGDFAHPGWDFCSGVGSPLGLRGK